MAHFAFVPGRLLGQEKAGRRSPASSAAFGRRARAGPQPDATASRGGNRTLRSDQAGEREHGLVPL